MPPDSAGYRAGRSMALHQSITAQHRPNNNVPTGPIGQRRWGQTVEANRTKRPIEPRKGPTRCTIRSRVDSPTDAPGLRAACRIGPRPTVSTPPRPGDRDNPSGPFSILPHRRMFHVKHRPPDRQGARSRVGKVVLLHSVWYRAGTPTAAPADPDISLSALRARFVGLPDHALSYPPSVVTHKSHSNRSTTWHIS